MWKRLENWLLIATFRSRARVSASFPSRKMLTQGAPSSPQIFVSEFNNLQMNGFFQKNGQGWLLSREIYAT